MRYTGPKNKLARREGFDLGLKTQGSKSQAHLLRRLNILPGQHGAKGRRKVSERGKQLREKQKLRYIYGVNEKQLKKYFQKAVKMKGNTALFLSQFLERRLDNIVYRLGFAPTRASARQLVSHNHIKINNRVVDVSSYHVKLNDVITFTDDKIMKVPYIEGILANKDIVVPGWLERKGPIGKLNNDPSSDLVENQVNLREVIEYYSR